MNQGEKINWVSDKKIMVVEDSETNALLTTIYLKGAGIKEENIVVAVDWLEAVGKSQQELFDLIIMDVNLPGINWLETSKLIKSNPQTSDIPIVGYTAAYGFVDAEKVFDDVIIRPIGKEAFWAKILEILNSQQINN